MSNKEFFARHGLVVNNNVLAANTITGNVGIGTNTASYKLEVVGAANISLPTLIVAGQNIIASFTSANNYAGVMANSVNANLSVATVSANNYAGVMANSVNANLSVVAASVNANLSVVGASVNANLSVATVSSNNYAGVMANSVNANLSVVGASVNANLSLATQSANNYADANKFAKTGGTISGDVIITGNLTTSGSLTYANTQTLLIGDNIIVLNADIPNNFVPVENASLEVNRGSRNSNAAITWNETANLWMFTGNTQNSLTTAIASNTSVDNAGIGANNYAGSMANSVNANLSVVGASVNANLSVATTSANNYARANAVAVGTAVNANISVATVSANNYADTKLANTSGVVFNGDLNISGNVNVDSATLFVDKNANRVGINSSTPTNLLTIEGGVTEIRTGGYLMLRPADNNWDMRLQANTGNKLNVLSGGDLGNAIMTFVHGGNVGIGNTNPQSLLHLQSASPNLNFTATTSSRTGYIGMTDGYNMFLNGPSTGYLILNNTGTNVGIGNTAPQSKLHVAGSVTLDNNYYLRQYNSTGTVYNILGVDTSNTTRLYSASGILHLNPDASSGSTYLNYNSPGFVQVGDGTNLVNVSVSKGVISTVSPNTGARWVISGKTLGKTNDSGLYQDGANNMQLAARDGSNNLRVVIDANTSTVSYINVGNVGIGTTTPTSKLDVNGIFNVGDGNQRINMYFSSGAYLLNKDNTKFYIGANNSTTQLVLDPTASAYVGIGTASPVTKLHVKGTWVSGEGILQIDADSGTQYSGLTMQNNGTVKYYIYNDNTNAINYIGSAGTEPLVFGYNATSEWMRLNSTGLGIGNTSPSSKLVVNATSTTAASLTWDAAAGQIFRNENSELAIGLSSSTPYPLYMQGRTSASAARNLSLQPLGGNVGIGNTNPGFPLVVQAGVGEVRVVGTNYSKFSWENTGAVTDAKKWQMWNDASANAFLISTLNDAENSAVVAMRIARSAGSVSNVCFESGSVGVGTTAPLSKLHVKGGTAGALADDGFVEFEDSSRNGISFGYNIVSNHAWIYGRSPGTDARQLQINNLLYVGKSSSSNVGIGTSSDNGSKLTTQRAAGATSYADVHITDGTQYIKLNSNTAAGSYNSLVQARDIQLIFSQGSAGTGGLVIAPWSGASDAGLRMDAAGNVAIGQATTTYKLQVNGSFAANTKSFVIDHPSKPGMKLRYGSLEGPENGVYIRGRLTNEHHIQFPDYWKDLVDIDSVTVQLTPIGKSKQPSVGDITDFGVNVIGKNIDCFYFIQAERKDVEKLVVEFDA